MAVAIKVTTTPSFLLTGWRSQGWSVVRQGVLRPAPFNANGSPAIPLQMDAFEWKDITLFGIGNADTALQQLRQYIQAGGSDLYAYALFTRTDINVLGLKVVSYRLVLLHSIVQLLEAAVVILAIAFAAIIFLQYITTGQAPALNDLKSLWGSAVASVGSAGGQITGAISQTYIVAALAVGGIAIALGVISKQAGTKTPPAPKVPGGSIGVRAGGVTARASA